MHVVVSLQDAILYVCPSSSVDSVFLSMLLPWRWHNHPALGKGTLTDLREAYIWCAFAFVMIFAMAGARALWLSHFHWAEVLPAAWPTLFLLILCIMKMEQRYVQMALQLSHLVLVGFLLWNMDSTAAMVNEKLEQDLSVFLRASNCTCTGRSVLDRLPFGVGLFVFVPYQAALLAATAALQPRVFDVRSARTIVVLVVLTALACMMPPVFSPQLYKPLPLIIAAILGPCGGMSKGFLDQRKIVELSHRVWQAEKKAKQQADTVLNHILKNNMADASGCIAMFIDGEPREVLSQAQNILFRGMWWCKLRQVMINVLTGEYHSELSAVNLLQFGQDLVKGRLNVSLKASGGTVLIDPIVWNILLDNALSNARMHCCPDKPQVHVRIRLVSPDDSPAGPMADNRCLDVEPTAASRMLEIVVSNHASPSKRKLDPWTSACPVTGRPHSAESPTSLSTGLGLEHIAMAANLSGISAQLWQEDNNTVVFMASQWVTMVNDLELVEAESEDARSGMKDPVLPTNLHICYLDDLPLARKSVVCAFKAHSPESVVRSFGETLAEVETFKRCVQKKCDIAMVDQHLDFPGKHILGTDVVKEILEVGFQGLVCIRSGNTSDEDRALYYESGVHCCFGKEEPMKTVIATLSKTYQAHFGSRPRPFGSLHSSAPASPSSPMPTSSMRQRSLVFRSSPSPGVLRVHPPEPVDLMSCVKPHSSSPMSISSFMSASSSIPASSSSRSLGLVMHNAWW